MTNSNENDADEVPKVEAADEAALKKAAELELDWQDAHGQRQRASQLFNNSTAWADELDYDPED